MDRVQREDERGHEARQPVLEEQRADPQHGEADPDVDDDGAVRQHARIGRLVAGNDAKLPLDELGRAVAALLGVEGKAQSDRPAVRFALLLALADRRQRARVRDPVRRAAPGHRA